MSTPIIVASSWSKFHYAAVKLNLLVFKVELTDWSFWSAVVCLHKELTYSIQQSPYWEANWFSASQEIPRILWNQKVYYRIHTCPPTVSFPSQINPPQFRSSILILSSHLRLGLPRGLFSQVSPPKPCVHLLSPPTRATCSAPLILLDFITRILFGEEYRSLSSSLCSFLHFPVTSSLLGSNILVSTLFYTSSAYLPPSMWATKFHTHTKKRQNYTSVHLNLYIFG